MVAAAVGHHEGNGLMTVKRAFAAAGLGALLLAASSGMALAETPSAAPLVDHHMHLRSPVASRVSQASCARLGPVKCPPLTSKAASTGEDAIQALDAAGIKRGVLLSLGYLFGSPNYTDLNLDVAKETRAENAYVVDQARQSCGRLVAFIGVDPLSPNAVPEVTYWGRKGGATGLKLHLGNSAVDLRAPDDVRKLAAVFRAAGRAHFPIIIHLETRAEDYGAQDVAVFLRDVAPAAGKVTIQVAHAAGGGGVNAHTLNALKAFAEAIRRDPAGTSNLMFDLAQAPDEMSNTAKLSAGPAELAELKALMQQIGLERFLLASDWTAGLNLKPYYEDEKAALAFSDAQWAALAANIAPYLRPPHAGACGK
jgi:predicted TIM-barrel fold metal-dependent hydrolase